MTDMLRAFVAIAVPGSVLDGIGGVQDGIRRHGFKIRWVRPAGIHLTLKFLGDIFLPAVDEVRQVMAETAARCSSFSLCAKGVGVFPGNDRPRVVWVGLAGQTGPLAELKQKLDKGLADAGFPGDPRPFKGHLTMGRVKGRIDAGRLGHAIARFDGFASPDFKVRAIHLIQSRLLPGGAEYTPLFSAGLGGERQLSSAGRHSADE